MSGGFFRGTSAEQDTRFSNKQAKLLKTQKFAPELENLVDITKVKMDVIKPWIARRVTELIGFEDEVLINFIYGLLDGKVINGKEVQIHLTGFMEKNTGKFMKELWALLISAQKNASGVPQQFLDAKEEETRKKKAETDRIFDEIQRRKEKETKEYENEKARKMDGGLDNISSEELNRRPERSSDPHSGDENGAGVTNGFRGRKRSPYLSDHSPSPRRAARSRSISRSYSRSRSYSKERSMSRSISGSPRARRRSFSPDRMHMSPRRRSITPKRRPTRGSISPRRRSHSGRRSPSLTRYRSPSPVRRRVRSPIRRRRSPSPLRRRSPSFTRRKSPSPRRRSRSPIRRRSPSPQRRRLPSSRRHRSPSPWNPRSRSPRRRRSPSPRRRRSPSLPRRHRSTSSSRSRSPVKRRPVSPVRHHYEAPIRRRSPIPVRRRSPSPNRRSLSPWGRRSETPGQSRSSSPVRRRSPFPAHRRSPIPTRRRSPVRSPSHSQSPASGSSASPIRHRAASPAKLKSPRPYKSLHKSPRGKIRTHEPARLDRGQPISLSPQRDHADENRSRRNRSISPSPEKSPSYVESPRARNRKRSMSPYESSRDRRTLDDNQSSPAKRKDLKVRNDGSVRSDEGLQNSRKDDENKSTEKGSGKPSGAKNRDSPDRPFSRRRHDGSDLRKENEIKREEVSKEVPTPKKSPRKGSFPEEMSDVPYGGDVKSEEKRSSHSKDAKDMTRSDSLLDSRRKVKRRSPSVDSDSGDEESDQQRAGDVEKRKLRRSNRREAASDDTSSDSETPDRKEAKRRRKEEKKLRKEERRLRREERRRRKEEKRASKRKRKSKVADLSSSDMEKDEKNAYGSTGEFGSRKYSTDEDAESQKKRLEIELREKALESLRAKKGISR